LLYLYLKDFSASHSPGEGDHQRAITFFEFLFPEQASPHGLKALVISANRSHQRRSDFASLATGTMESRHIVFLWAQGHNAVFAVFLIPRPLIQTQKLSGLIGRSGMKIETPEEREEGISGRF
jgi:hypothetical protein